MLTRALQRRSATDAPHQVKAGIGDKELPSGGYQARAAPGRRMLTIMVA